MSVEQQVDEPVTATPTVTSGAMIRTLGGIATISGLLVVLVYQATLPIIEENKRIAIEKAVFQVVPSGAVRADFTLGEDQALPASEKGEGIAIYAGYDSDGNLAGIAAEAAAQGYQDVIRLLFGYNPACECITGIKVLKMAETPGLGDKIITDANFVANFNALDSRLSPGGDQLLNPIVTVKSGSKKNPWEIDAISGATISSKAVGKALNKAAQVIVPLVMKYRSTLAEYKPTPPVVEPTGGEQASTTASEEK